MIRQLLGRFFRRRQNGQDQAQPGPKPQAQVLRASELGLDLATVSQPAMRTCETLQQAGFKAFIVGGGVRDLLLGRRPKDFDVATNATPEEVVKLFRRARTIGKRFQIVHVYFGRELIEVSTFRAIQTEAETDAHGEVVNHGVFVVGGAPCGVLARVHGAGVATDTAARTAPVLVAQEVA